MRKSLLLILVLFLTALCACAAADTEYALGPVTGGTMTINEDTYIVLTPDNLPMHPDLISSIGKTQEEILSDWESRGVLLQAWAKNTKKPLSFEVSVFQDDISGQYYDLEMHTPAERSKYLGDVAAQLKSEGFLINSKDIKLHSKSGHYAVINYVLHEENVTRHGVIHRTVRNGYNVVVNYEVYNRQIARTDEDKSNALINKILISTEVTAVPSSGTQADGTDPENVSGTPEYTGEGIPKGAGTMLGVTVPPPEKTNSGVFTVEGTAFPGSEVIIVAMRMSSTSEAHRFTAIATKAGNFKTKITLPSEGVYSLTINNYIGETPLESDLDLLKVVTYQKTLLPYALDAEIPERLTTDELVISGTTDKAVTVQCIVENGVTTFDKTIRTNGTGKFKFKIDTSLEAEYNIALTFSKKGLNLERKSWKATRQLTAEDNQARSMKKALKASYSALVKKLDTYIGQTMVYDAYIVSVEQTGEEWAVMAALKKSKGAYSNLLVYMAKEDPRLTVDSKMKIYGTCFGAYKFQTEEGDSSCPGFDFISAE